MQTFNFNLKVQISDTWVEDGWDENLIKKKIKQYVEETMNPYCCPIAEFKCDISPIKKIN